MDGVATQEFNERGMAVTGFAGKNRAAGAATEPGIAFDVAGPGNADAGGVDGGAARRGVPCRLCGEQRRAAGVDEEPFE